MHIETILSNFNRDKNIPEEVLDAIENDSVLRLEMIHYFRNIKNREFVVQLLDMMIAIRKKSGLLSGDDLMLACYILGQHQQIEDCLKIWQAKTIDFDSFSYIDVQLIPFLGVEAVIDFLQKQSNDEAKKALAYIIECNEAGDFDNLDKYYSIGHMPWWV
jgi:hypothetical protein